MTTAQQGDLGEWLMIRVAGLPIDVLDGLRSPRSAEWAGEVVDTEAELVSRVEPISDRLHEVIGNTGQKDVRRALLKFRRQLFNNQLPTNAESVLEQLDRVEPDLAVTVRTWLDDRRAFADLLESGVELVRAERAAGRAHLREIAEYDRLRAGLLLASPTLAGRARTLLGSSGDKLGKNERKAERAMMSYVYRTAGKPSPFSSLTGLRLGRMGSAGHGPNEVVEYGRKWESRVRLNVVVLARISAQLRQVAEYRADLPLTIASGADREDDRIRYVRRWVTTGDESAAVTLDSVTEGLFFLRNSAVLNPLLQYLEHNPGVRFAEAADWLREQTGADAGECDYYLTALLDVGIVQVPSLTTDVHVPDPLRSFQRMLRESITRDWADEVAEHLEEPAAALEAYPDADVEARVDLLHRVRSGMATAMERLGLTDPAIPQTLVYEDVVEQSDPVPYDRTSWQERLSGPLASVERLLPVFDLTLPHKMLFKGFFRVRYGVGGRCDDVLTLLHNFYEDFFEQYLSFTAQRSSFDDDGEYIGEENWLNLPELQALDEARREFVSGMRERASRDPDAAEIVLDDTFVDRVSGCLADATTTTPVHAHFVQVAEDDETERFVLNQSYGGLFFPFSRFAYCFDDVGDGVDLTDTLRASAREFPSSGAVFAEVTGGMVTSNLNLHGRFTDYQIVCPGETSTAPLEQQIGLDDLFITHDAVGDRLVLQSRRLGVEVVPVYLGYLLPLALPDIPRALLLLSLTSMASINPWWGVPESPAHDGVTYRPRVSHADVVLRRRTWSAHAADLPLADTTTEDSTKLVAWCRWRRKHGVPVHAFAKVSEPSSGIQQLGDNKPQYVDFDSVLSLTALESLVKNPDSSVVFTEMLPTPDQLVAQSAEGHHVTEFAIETYSRSVPYGAVDQGET